MFNADKGMKKVQGRNGATSQRHHYLWNQLDIRPLNLNALLPLRH